MVSIMKSKNNNSINPFANRSSTIMNYIDFVGGLATMSGHTISVAIAQKHDWDDENVEFVPKHIHKEHGKAQRRHNTETAHAKRLKKYGTGWVTEAELKERLDPRELGMLMEGESKCWAHIRDYRLCKSLYYDLSQKWDKGQKQKPLKVYEMELPHYTFKEAYEKWVELKERLVQVKDDLDISIFDRDIYSHRLDDLTPSLEAAESFLSKEEKRARYCFNAYNKKVQEIVDLLRKDKDELISNIKQVEEKNDKLRETISDLEESISRLEQEYLF